MIGCMKVSSLLNQQLGEIQRIVLCSTMKRRVAQLENKNDYPKMIYSIFYHNQLIATESREVEYGHGNRVLSSLYFSKYNSSHYFVTIVHVG